MTTLTYSGVLVVTKCWCGMSHAVPQELYNEARLAGNTVYCPLGHRWVFHDHSELARVKARLASVEESREFYRTESERVELRRRAAQGQLTKTKNRIAKGVCPCCKRHFAKLAAHIKTKHPNYVKEPPQ